MQLDELPKLGVRIAIDDFGTGFSSLGQLRDFPLDMIKVDRSFVQGVEHNAKDAAITANLVTLAHALGVVAIAEGIESSGQLATGAGGRLRPGAGLPLRPSAAGGRVRGAARGSGRRLGARRGLGLGGRDGVCAERPLERGDESRAERVRDVAVIRPSAWSGVIASR